VSKMSADVTAHLKSAGARNLQEFGYPDVTADNITSDPIYSQFFALMLRDNLGHGFDKEINALLAEINPA